MAKKKGDKFVTLIRSDNRVVVDPAAGYEDKVYDLLVPGLVYTETVFLRGRKKFDAIRAGRRAVERIDWECFSLDHRDRLAVPIGFLDRIQKALSSSGYEVRERDLSGKPPRPLAYTPNWDRVADVDFRAGQRPVLELIVNEQNARIDCPPGWGKSFLIGCAAAVLSRAKIAVITRGVEVMQQRIYPELCGMLPNVGIVGGGMKRRGRRVMCYTAGSIHHADGDEDYVFFDEGHEAAADDCAEKMAKFERARMFAFSGSWDMRLDNKDMRCEAMFGPIRYKTEYAEAEAEGMVVPLTVQLTNVVSDVDPCGTASDVDKERLGIWANDKRNALIAEDARIYGPETQCLITVKTFEHALHLKRLLPEYEIVYNSDSQKDSDWAWYRNEGLLGDDFKVLTAEGRAGLRRRFERNKLRKVIATPVWNRGVDMMYLQVVLRADAGGSPINDTQIPGRSSRVKTENGMEKVSAVVHDYLDQFNSGFARKADGRVKTYGVHNWRVLRPHQKDPAKLRRLVAWKKKED